MNRLFESIFLLLQTVMNGIGRIPLKFAGSLAKDVCGGKIAMQRSADDQNGFLIRYKKKRQHRKYTSVINVNYSILKCAINFTLDISFAMGFCCL